MPAGRERSDTPDRRPERPTNFAEYLYACHRKIAMAAYHGRRFFQVLDIPTIGQDVPIPIQAECEGVLYCLIAATDQLAEGLCRAYGLGRRPRGYTPLQWALERVGEQPEIQPISAWAGSGIVTYAHALRNKAAHHFYDKSRGGRDYVIGSLSDVVESAYNGSNSVPEFIAAVTEHTVQLHPLIEVLADTRGVTHDGWRAELASIQNQD
jgi:hypothetical protein